MKLKSHFSLLTFALLPTTTLLLAAGWLIDRARQAETSPLLLVYVSACAAVCAIACRLHLASQEKYRKSAALYLEAICRVDRRDCGENLAETLPPPEAGNPYQEVVQRVEQCVVASHQRLMEAEHQRACAEVRSRRAAAEIEQLTNILNGLNEPVIAIDAFDEISLANPSAERLLHLELENPERRAIAGIAQCEGLVGLLLEARRRKTPIQRTGEISLPDAGGATRTYRVSCRSIQAASTDGRPAAVDVRPGAVAVLTDITNEKQIQKRNAEFVSAASHEMKAPLSGIKAYVELLADGDNDEQQCEEFLGVISSQADRLQRLVENLLNLARIEAGVVEVRKAPYSLNELLNEAFGVVQPSAQQKNIQLIGDLSPLYLGVLADRDMLLQSAINLLSNAIKYTHVGGKVTLRSRVDDRDVVFEVEDTGVGLAPEDCDKVFEKFYRVKKDATMAPGTGLGLPLAKHIVEDVHGGRLTLKSQLGVGSTFRVTLPGAVRMNEK